MGELIDNIDKRCSQCKKGKYIETSLFDDIDGKLHCSKCKHEIKRYVYDCGCEDPYGCQCHTRR